MERLTEMTAIGILVKAGYGESVLKNLYTENDYGYCAMEKLAEYEDLEQQRKLLRLPCAVGDMVYVIPSITNYKLNIVNGFKELNRVYEQIVNRIEISKSGYLLSTCDGMSSVIEEFYKVTWFLVKEEADTALEELTRECKEMEYEID